jgi:hypothetical protein
MGDDIVNRDAIFLVKDSGELQRVEHELYASEDILQALVAKHPDVLAGDQIDPEAPPRWLLLRREASVPDSATGEGRWWLDHLLLDQYAKPTLVEVKRSTDSRIRREVIGQMLDYIANAQAYWAAGRMREMLGDESGSIEAGDERLAEFLELNEAPERAEEIGRFWQRVEANLRRGDVRLLFVADELPKELRRLIEFLNEQFTNIEVLGVELRQYVGEGIKALVPRVIGQTEAARDQKERSTPRSRPPSATADWTTREEFLRRCPEEAAKFFASVLDDAERQGHSISWGTKGFSVRAAGRPVFFYGYPPGARGRATADIEIFLRDLADAQLAQEIREGFTSLPGIETSGSFTLRLPVRGDNRSVADRAWEMSLNYMQRQL